MGIDVHGLNLLMHAKKKKLFGNTITIGRQGLHVKERLVKKLVDAEPSYKNQIYCEELLTEYFGATVVNSIDNSAYENATHIHDMNEPLPMSLHEKYDTVIDGGCLEHIYNAPQAFRNCSKFCKPGGQILHMLPANNFCGHGFWQFSPELFFSLYSKKNGYEETEVFIADLSDTQKWYQVKEPKNGERVNVFSSTALYVLVRTVLKNDEFSHAEVQQSDYLYEWENQSFSELQSTGLKQKLKKINFLYRILSPAYHFYLRIQRETGLNGRNPGLVVIDLKSFI
ncbi:methyltransferase domain-containing protein [Noviherbaspirillum sedimenti]|uniref:Methyltransferase domain-containing protein n=1 Tax=Noviherbaspirillum sedimenti TaxID=2320865 RepID=A0A3A3FYI6_9BURK|nr:methyltransferase domain-containing protein [Noviherbaspirillum sedimenti]RJG01278.1 methyltransferase domain-containing protein [Noviherbaspirillum sedimenti]